MLVLDQVAVYEHTWTTEDPSAGSAAPSEHPREGEPQPEGETGTHVVVYTLHLSGLKQRYRHFIQQPDGAMIEVGHQHVLYNDSIIMYFSLIQEKYSNFTAGNMVNGSC